MLSRLFPFSFTLLRGFFFFHGTAAGTRVTANSFAFTADGGAVFRNSHLFCQRLLPLFHHSPHDFFVIKRNAFSLSFSRAHAKGDLMFGSPFSKYPQAGHFEHVCTEQSRHGLSFLMRSFKTYLFNFFHCSENFSFFRS